MDLLQNCFCVGPLRRTKQVYSILKSSSFAILENPWLMDTEQTLSH